MKKVIFILLLTISVFAKDTKAQAVPDTLAYLQTLVNNKATYIGQPFSVLKDSLQIQIKYFSPYPSLPYDMTKETSTSLAFYNPTSMDDFYLIYPTLEVYWQPYLNATQAGVLFRSTGGGWTTAIANFYASGIIADIQIVE